MPSTLSPQEFVDKWRGIELKERSASQEHFLNLCRLIGHPTLVESDCAFGQHCLTNLYNRRPTWLDLAHKKLDEAVLDAYGWPHDITDEEILERLLALADLVVTEE